MASVLLLVYQLLNRCGYIVDQGMLHGVQVFFENQFIEAQTIFASQEHINPVYALGSGSLAFMKGIMVLERGVYLIIVCQGSKFAARF